jgi:hypothetical protein
MVLAQLQKGSFVQVYPRKTALPKIKAIYPNK